MRADGDDISFPPVEISEGLLHTLQLIGFCANIGMGRFPIPPERLCAWAAGTCTDINPQDFEDLLYLSSVYCTACAEYDKNNIASPWQPEMTQEEEKAHNKSVERAMDMAMGIS